MVCLFSAKFRMFYEKVGSVILLFYAPLEKAVPLQDHEESMKIPRKRRREGDVSFIF